MDMTLKPLEGHYQRNFTVSTPRGQTVRGIACSRYSCRWIGHPILPAMSHPQEMLPLLDRPCIDYIVTEAADAGIERSSSSPPRKMR